MEKINQNKTDFSEIKNLVLEMGKIAKENAFADLKISKKTGEELVTELDVELEKMARNKIKQLFGQVDFLGEEFGEQIEKKSKYKFIIDPIDGTESYINKEFNSSVSLAIENLRENKIVFGAVYDFMKDILYTNINGKNEVYFNGNKVNIPEIESDKIKFMVTGRKNKVDQIINNLDAFENNYNFRISRQYGSIALQMSQVSNGMYDIYIRPDKIKTWDIAGAIKQIYSNENLNVVDYNGNKFDYKNPDNGIIIYKKEYKYLIQRIINNN